MTMHTPHRTTPSGAPARPVGVRLEPGEQILWQGRPEASALRRHLLKGRWLAAYFAVLLGWKLTLIVALRGLHPQEMYIPLRAIRSVAVRMHGDGTGDVALAVRDGGGVGYSKLWPHVRGLSPSAPVPMLRGLRDAAILGTRLARRLDGPAPAMSGQDIRPEAAPHATAA